KKKAYSAADIAKAWSPFYILTAANTIWSLPAFKALFQEGGLLYQTTLLCKMPFLHQQIMKLPPMAPSAMPWDAVCKGELLA
ncbi:L-lactate permease, partial [Bacillus vallismortis]|nr:L-lactate permease [Bacillus vallismortis]